MIPGAKASNTIAALIEPMKQLRMFPLTASSHLRKENVLPLLERQHRDSF